MVIGIKEGANIFWPNALRAWGHPSSLGGPSHDLELLLGRLEPSVSELGGGIDELELDLFQGVPGGLVEQGPSEGDTPLLGSNNCPLEHEVVVLDHSVVGEASERVDVLIGWVEGGGALEGVLSNLADLVNLLVDLRSVVESVLTGPWDAESDPRRMPRSDAGDLPQTSVRLPWEPGHSPPGDDALRSSTLGDTNRVDHLVLTEDGIHRDGLLEIGHSEVNLLRDASSVDLNLHHVRLLLAHGDLANLGVRQNTDDAALLLHLRELSLDLLLSVGVLLRVLGEGLLLGLVKVLVELPLDLLAEVLSEDGLQGLDPVEGLDVPDNTDDDHGRAVQNSDGLAGLLLMNLRARLLHVTGDVGHPGLVSHEGREVGLLRRIVLRERLDLSLSSAATLLRQETERTVTGVLKLTVRHDSLLLFFVAPERKELGALANSLPPLPPPPLLRDFGADSV